MKTGYFNVKLRCKLLEPTIYQDNMKYTSLTIICLLLLTSGCNKKQTQIAELKVSHSDTTWLMVKDSVFLPINLELWNFSIKGKYVALFSPESDNHCPIYSFSDGHEVRNIGRRGHSKDEFVSCNWCKTNSEDNISLYDIMRGKLFVYSLIGRQDTVVYTLPKGTDGLTMPIMSISQYSGSKFLAKCDGETSELQLVDLKKGNMLHSYPCMLRDEKQHSYTPFDYVLDVMGEHVLMAYCYFDRMELLTIIGDKINPVAFCGVQSFENIPSDYNQLKYRYLSVCHGNGCFYVLKGNGEYDCGDEVVCVDVKKKETHLLKLDRNVKAIDVDTDGHLVGYEELANGCVLYVF